MKELKIIQDKKYNKEKLLKQRGNNYMSCVNKIINKTNGIIHGYTLKQEKNEIKKKKIIRWRRRKRRSR